MKNVAIIRDRGQLTIPDNIRKAVSCAMPMSVVSISVTQADEIVIKPHQAHFDADKIWKFIRRSRANKGKGKGSATKFIIQDRHSH